MSGTIGVTANCIRPKPKSGMREVEQDGGVERDPESIGSAAMECEEEMFSRGIEPLEDKRLDDEASAQEELIAEDFEEGRAPKLLTTPYTPSKAEIEAHEATHWPFRAWCPDCVQGRGRNTAHRSSHRDLQESGDPMIVADYCYMSGSDRMIDEEKSSGPILVMREVRTGATMSMAVPAKGDGVLWVNERCARWVDDLGFQKVTFKSDQEPSIIALIAAIKRCREPGAQTIVEHSPVGESQSNGAAERAVGEVKGMIRTLRVGLDRKLDAKLEANHVIFPWLIEHAGVLISRHKVWNDGRTAYETIKGKRASTPLCGFAERIMFFAFGDSDRAQVAVWRVPRAHPEEQRVCDCQ